jgi:hypothetical protein
MGKSGFFLMNIKVGVFFGKMREKILFFTHFQKTKRIYSSYLFRKFVFLAGCKSYKISLCEVFPVAVLLLPHRVVSECVAWGLRTRAWAGTLSSRTREGPIWSSWAARCSWCRRRSLSRTRRYRIGCG